MRNKRKTKRKPTKQEALAETNDITNDIIAAILDATPGLTMDRFEQLADRFKHDDRFTEFFHIMLAPIVKFMRERDLVLLLSTIDPPAREKERPH